ncbi:PREDICTED: spermatogenesis associated 6-like protein [Elephantulus edwardii]|uniref:spermatogenesis associated 6-like protein n=1 Tax=Elephantulus edwardii TaxID=28737 RepID=UPI0003F0CFC4|nr:PREDICTED: spermatogenesis associated 6-like protein [Elephantulus edwardii]
MPLEVVVELQIRAVSCPGVFLPSKRGVYLGVYFLNQYLETDCFPPVFPIVIHQNMKFEKVFENAVDPGAVADLLEVWEKLAFYEENTRDFLFPEPRLTHSYPGLCREVLMKTVAGFPGIAPKLEFSTRTAIRECTYLYRNRFLGDRHKSQRPFSTSPGPVSPLNSTKRKPKECNPKRTSRGLPSCSSSPHPTRHLFRDHPTPLTFGNSLKFAREIRPPFVVRHVDSAKPFGEAVSERRSQKSRRKCKLSSAPCSMKRASSLDSRAPNVKVIKEPDERIIFKSNSPSRSHHLDSCTFGKASPSSSSPGDARFQQRTSVVLAKHLRSACPLLDRPLLRERFHPSFHSKWKKIHERVCELLAFCNAQLPAQTKKVHGGDGYRRQCLVS